MKVLQLANNYFNTKLYQLLFEALVKNSIDNVVFIPVQYGDKRCKEKSMDNSRVGEFIVKECFSNWDRLMYFTKQKKMISEIERNVNLSAVDIVHAHTLFSAGYSAMKIKKKYGIPYIVAVRDTDVNVFFKNAFYLRKTGIEILKNASNVIFLSSVYRDSLLDKYVPQKEKERIKRKSVVIPNGISDIFLEHIEKPHELDISNIRIIYAGEINKRKNVNKTIEAVKLLQKKGYNVSFIVVGDAIGHYGKSVIANPVVNHYPRCNQMRLIQHYRNADIFVMPSHTETFGLVYAEAMSQGLPILYTKGQGFDGYFRDGVVGYAVSDKDAKEIASKILKVCKNYKQMSSAAIENVSRFDWNKIGRKYAGRYRDVLTNS